MPLTLKELGSICDQEPGVCFSRGQNGTDEPAKCFCLNALGETAIKENPLISNEKSNKRTGSKHLKTGKCMIQKTRQEEQIKEITNVFHIFLHVYFAVSMAGEKKKLDLISKHGIITFTASQLF